MKKVFLKGLPSFQFHILQKFSTGAEHAVFSRAGGVSEKPFDSLNVRFGIGDRHEKVVENRKKICDSLGLKYGRLVSANQTHGKNVATVDERMLESLQRGGENFLADEIENADALVTDLCGTGLMIQVADCQAILMFDPVRKVAAAVHAGWKGLAQNVSGEAIAVMREKFGVDPANILAGVAPSLGPCCAFFSNPEKELPSTFHKFIDARKRVDLWSFSIEQLQKNGISPGNIELARVCTQCGNGKDISGPHKFFSFRGEHGITGRFGVVIALRRGV